MDELSRATGGGGGEEKVEEICRYELIDGHDDFSHYLSITLTMFINVQLIQRMNDGVGGDWRWRRWIE